MNELIGPDLKSQLQDVNESAMPSTCTVHNKVPTRVASGSTITVGPAVGGPYKCRKGTAFTVELPAGGGTRTVLRWTLTLERTAVVAMDQVIRLTGDGDYEVKAIVGGDYAFNPQVHIERYGS